MRSIHKTTLIGIYTYCASTLFWATLCILADDFFKNDDGIISTSGFLMIFTISIFLANEEIKIRQLIYSAILIPLIFITASFLVFPFTVWLLWLTDLPEFTAKPLLVVLSSIVASLGLSLVMKYLYKIDSFPRLFLLFIILSLISNYLVYLINDLLFASYNLPKWLTMFIVWQSLMILPIFYLLNKKNLKETE